MTAHTPNDKPTTLATKRAATERALILDFGGVISRTLFETHAMTEQALGLPAGTLTWRGPFASADASDADALWQAMQRGQITERDYWRQRTQEVAQLVGAQWTDMADFVKAARGAEPALVIRPEAVNAIHAAQQAGCKLAILSNELDLFYGAAFRQQLPLLQSFDVIVDATYTGILKPDPRAYQQCLDELGIRAEAAVFVDDQSRNVQGARALGIPTVAFDVHDPAGSYAEALRLSGV